jgi:choloylglycine hydrolase
VKSIVLYFALFIPSAALSCTAFMIRGENGPIVAKGYDWNEERGLVIINKRGLQKRALTLSPDDKPAQWKSRFASLTFNQYGRELPNGGINEDGLVVEVLMLPSSRFAPPDGRATVTELGFVQYLLDQAATLDEAVALAARVRVAPAYAKVHYFVCDQQAACATLEFLDGALVATRGSELPVSALTNSTYADSKRSLAVHKAPAPQSSLGRFRRVASAIAEPAKQSELDQAWSVLDSVHFVDSTQWQVVYDLRARRVQFRSRRHPTIKTVSLDHFDRECATPTLVYDMLSDESGDVGAHFAPYDDQRNLALVKTTLEPLRSKLPPGTVENVARFPSTLSCAR